MTDTGSCLEVSCHDLAAAIWVAFFSGWRRYCCWQVNADYKPPPPHPKYFVAVSDLTMKNVKATNCGKQPFIQCPKESPCTGIDLENVEIGVKGETAKMSCAFAHGTATGVKPKSCLLPP